LLCYKERGNNYVTIREKVKEVKMAALVGGLISLILGIIGIVIFWGYFVKALAAGIPALLILGGALATYLGIEEIKDKRSAMKYDEKPDTSELKGEVESLKKEVEDLKKEE
jgi:small neutral amino acid transporter SnatA (MarC family)